MDHEAENLLTGTRRAPGHARLAVVRNQEAAEGTFLLTLEAGSEQVPVEPGQFFMVGFPGVLDPLLPRPFAAFDLDRGRLDIVYQRVGRGTGLLSEVRPGATLQVFGPLGRGYRIEVPRGRGALLVAGGIGFASVHLLLKRLLAAGRPVTLLYGARSPGRLYPLAPALRRHPCLEIHLATEDGGEGARGSVFDLWRLLAGRDAGFMARHGQVFLCGPQAMLRAFAPALRSHEGAVQVSLEANMACGYGVCQGCAVRAAAGPGAPSVAYRKVCTDGPVFSLEALDWGKMERGAER